ncbi:MAG TPA: ABC transporter ATP-binding protein [Vicinamibacterales bacterium]|nr:ABC transporter ATP-binding protein [Vicinamibacterales bacterium]
MSLDFHSLALTDVTRTFGRRRALHKVSLRVEAGELVVVLGPNGAGKSTLLAIVSTLLAPSAGDVRYGDYTSAMGAALRARIGLLGHDLYLYPELSPAENLRFFAGLYGIDRVEERIVAALDRAGLSDRSDDPVAGFSRGMRQRLALERALLHDPRLVLLDEPFTGLDDAATGALVGRLRQLRASGCLTIVITHDLDTVDGVVDRALMLHRGRLLDVANGGGPLRERYRAALAHAPQPAAGRL